MSPPEIAKAIASARADFERHANWLALVPVKSRRKVVRRRLTTPEFDEAFAEFLAKIWSDGRLIARYDPKHGAGYFFTSFDHVCLQLIRKWENRREITLEPAHVQSEVTSSGSAVERALLEWLNELDDQARSLLIKHFVEERPLRELEDEFGVTFATLSRRINKVLTSARARLEAYRAPQRRDQGGRS